MTTIAILIKLLLISMVANKYLGRSRRISIFRNDEGDSCSKIFRSLGLRENRATSEADINAEQISKTIRTRIPKEIFQKNGDNNIYKTE